MNHKLPGLFVSTEWLAEQLNDENLRIIDIRGHVLPASEPPPHYFAHHDEYELGHIPGAVFVDWTADITDPDSPNGTQIAKPDDYALLMSRLGVGNGEDDDTKVVIYDDADGMFAARLWWSLNYYGHTNAAVLEGGWQKWVLEGRIVTAAVPEITPAQFVPRPNASIRRTIAQVQNAVDTTTVLVDMRSTKEFNGEASRAKRAGHIPGAVNMPRKTLLEADGRLLAPDALREKFKSAGIDPQTTEVVVYCNAGVSASYGMLALKAAGVENVSVYDGSWKEWGNDATRPIA